MTSSGPPPEPVAHSADWFTAEPSASRARELHVSYRGQMRRQFLSALGSAADGLGVDLSPLVHRVEGLSTAESLSPAAYVELTLLSDALRSGDVTGVTDRLQGLSILPDGELRDASFRIQPVLTERWETDFIASVRSDRVDGRNEESRLVRALVGQDPSREIAACEMALELLDEVDPELMAEFREYVTRVKLFLGRGYLGFSSPAAFGAVFIRLPDGDPLMHFLEHLVHELSHLSLNVLMAHDPLLRNPLHEEAAPLRSDVRPLYQVLHATFVLSRNVRVMRRVQERRQDRSDEAVLRGFETQYREGFRMIEAEAEFTELGAQLFQTFEPIPD